MQHILPLLPIFLALTPTNARWLEATSIVPILFNITSNEWQTELLDPVIWYDRIDLEESQNNADRSFLTGRRGDVYDCWNNIVPPGAVLGTIGYYMGDVNPQLPERLNRLEIHRVEDCEDDHPLELALELEDGWGGGELGPQEDPNPQNQNPWLRYNNNPGVSETEFSRDRIEEDIYDQNDVIEEEPAIPVDDEWIPRGDGDFKKLRKREPQAPPGSDEYLEEGVGVPIVDSPTTNQQQFQPGPPDPNFNSPEPNINPNRGLLANLEPLTPESDTSFENVFANRNQPNRATFRRLENDFEGGFGGGGEGQADWDPMEISESEDETESIQFPQPQPRARNELPVRFPPNEIPIGNIQPPVIQNLRIQDPHGLLANGRAIPPRDTEEWLLDNNQLHNSQPDEQQPLPPSRPDVQILFAKLWPEYADIELGPKTSFRFVFDPYVVHDIDAV
ncbi:hypothetical protein TWF718_002419 [Orbilia javanica]|uniref:Uncharacterized protein n=1 Tax=Orbilia javanica TaxID=47235 RepID=A0AAN8MFZ2_9PEZI